MADNFLRQGLAQSEFVCSAELVLGRDHSAAEAEAFVTDAAAEPHGIRVISLTDLPGGNPALPPEAFAGYVLEHGLTPIAHVTGKDGNRSLIEGRLHSLARLGAENVLALDRRRAEGWLPGPLQAGARSGLGADPDADAGARARAWTTRSACARPAPRPSISIPARW